MKAKPLWGVKANLRVLCAPLLILGITVLAARVARGDVVYPPGSPTLGARYDATAENIRFRVYSSRATRLVVYVYEKAFGTDEKAQFPLAKEPGSDIWAVTVPVAMLQEKGIKETVYYGYRAWGNNWKFDAAWDKGSQIGFVADVDSDGNRFNPNKLLMDPYAAELSHDPVNPGQLDGSVYASGPVHRLQDTGRVAPKGIVLKPDNTAVGARPSRPLKDEIIYEVHLRGFTFRALWRDLQAPRLPFSSAGRLRLPIPLRGQFGAGATRNGNVKP